MEGHDCDRTVSPSNIFIRTFSNLSTRDRIADLIRTQLNLSAEDLSLAQVLEGATWKGGREIARIRRPDTGGPPIEIESDGTIF